MKHFTDQHTGSSRRAARSPPSPPPRETGYLHSSSAPTDEPFVLSRRPAASLNHLHNNKEMTDEKTPSRSPNPEVSAQLAAGRLLVPTTAGRDGAERQFTRRGRSDGNTGSHLGQLKAAGPEPRQETALEEDRV